MKPAEVADLLDSSGHAFASTLNASPPEVASWHPAPGEWCVNEVVGHVIEAEKRGFAGRIRIILGEDEPDLQTWDQEAVGIRVAEDGQRTALHANVSVTGPNPVRAVTAGTP